MNGALPFIQGITYALVIIPGIIALVTGLLRLDVPFGNVTPIGPDVRSRRR
jgi:hypothetical protein